MHRRCRKRGAKHNGDKKRQGHRAVSAGLKREARRLVERFEWHYTPKHGSWLDKAESELAVLTSQCVDRRIPDQQTLKDEVTARETERNAKHAKADWQFTTSDARVKLKRLYPAL
jgi:ribosomal protein L15